MSFSSFISNRLSLKDGARRKWAPAIVVATGGIALSLAIMMVAVAVVTGFKREITHEIMGFDAQVTVTPVAAWYGAGSMPIDYDDAMRKVVSDAAASMNVTREPEVVVALQQTGLIKTDDDFMGVLFKAYGDGYSWDFEKRNLLDGAVPSDGNPRGIVISSSMAKKLMLNLGDKVSAYFFIDGTVRPRRFEIVGIYCSNFGEYDDLVAYASHSVIAKLQKYTSCQGNAIEIRGLENEEVQPFAERLQAMSAAAYARGSLRQSVAVGTVYSSGAAYFNWLDMLDTNIVVIMILMGCVSGFMLVSCVLILILERVKMVGILKSLGATNRQIAMIFVRLGERVTGIGLLLGNLFGLAIIAVQWKWHLLPLDPASYYLSYVPVELTWVAWMLLNAGAALFAFVVMLVPSATVSRLSPVKVMRFE